MTDSKQQTKGSSNSNLGDAKRNKNDEFYTRLEDVSNELHHYRHHFKNKVVYCNCDDPYVSAFFEYFSKNFEELGLKKLITTCYRNRKAGQFSEHDSKQAVKLVYEGGAALSMPTIEDAVMTPLKGDGDFRSPECLELLNEADIVVTNPPFSLFREYIAQLIEHDKRFLVVGNMNAITYREVFPLVKSNKLWLGYKSTSRDMYFYVTDEHAKTLVETKKEGSAWVRIDGKIYGRLASAIWFTNLDHDKRHRPLDLYKQYSPDEFPHYDNYDAIEVGRVAEIPEDWNGIMGVPITFLDKYCPEQFEIIGITKTWDDPAGFKTKIYPMQTQVSKSGKKSSVSKLNDGAAIELEEPPSSTHYIVQEKIYIQLYARLLIRKKI